MNDLANDESTPSSDQEDGRRLKASHQAGENGDLERVSGVDGRASGLRAPRPKGRRRRQASWASRASSASLPGPLDDVTRVHLDPQPLSRWQAPRPDAGSSRDDDEARRRPGPMRRRRGATRLDEPPSPIATWPPVGLDWGSRDVRTPSPGTCLSPRFRYVPGPSEPRTARASSRLTWPATRAATPRVSSASP